MNAKLWACVIVGVVVAHLSVIFIVEHLRTIGAPPPPPPKEFKPTFGATTRMQFDSSGRKVNVEHHFTVSTELADEKTLGELPQPPSQSDSPAPAGAPSEVASGQSAERR